MKIYAVTVQELKKEERQDETQFTTKTEVPPPLNNASVFFFFEFHPIYDQAQGSKCCFPHFIDNSIIYF